MSEARKTTPVAVATDLEPTQQSWANSIMQVPEANDDAEERIVAQIMSATRPEELSAPWDSADSLDLLDQPQEVISIARSVSDYPSPWGHFLVVSSVVLATGEKKTWTTGSAAVMAQLIQAYLRGWLPLRCILRQSTRPTKAGYLPQHLEILPRG